MQQVNVYILEGKLTPLEDDQTCEVCQQLISIDEGEARLVEHSWHNDTWRHKSPEWCIHALARVIANNATN